MILVSSAANHRFTLFATKLVRIWLERVKAVSAPQAARDDDEGEWVRSISNIFGGCLDFKLSGSGLCGQGGGTVSRYSSHLIEGLVTETGMLLGKNVDEGCGCGHALIWNPVLIYIFF
jgi:hypothetical protein